MRAVGKGNVDPDNNRETPAVKISHTENSTEALAESTKVSSKSYTQLIDLFRTDLPKTQLTFLPALNSLITDIVFKKTFKLDSLTAINQQCIKLGFNYQQRSTEILIQGELNSKPFELKFNISKTRPLIEYKLHNGAEEIEKSFYIIKDEDISDETVTMEGHVSGSNPEINKVILFPALENKSPELKVTKNEAPDSQITINQKPVIEIVNNQLISNREDVKFWSKAFVNYPGVLQCIYAITLEGDTQTMSAYIAQAPEYKFSKVPLMYSAENPYHKLLIDNNQTLWIPSIQGSPAYCDYGTNRMQLSILP